LLDFNRLEAGKFTIDPKLLNLVPLAQRVVNELSQSVPDFQIEFITDREEVLISADELRLEQVIQNLLQNAIKYSPDKGNINVTVKNTETEILLTIKDCGIGIAPGEIPHLFTRFYRINDEKVSQISGLGLGLYIVKEIVTLHNASITVESEKDQGTTFTIHLPPNRGQRSEIRKMQEHS
jgi:signal transduction histidine kinase